MKKLFEWFGILPIAMIGMLISLTTDEEMKEHAKRNCVAYLYYLLIFILLYILLVYAKINRYVAILLTSIVWVIVFLGRKCYNSNSI